MTIKSIKSISQIHQLLSLGPPDHPLITLLEAKHLKGLDLDVTSVRTNLYIIALKGDNTCNMTYGHSSYDYEEGSLTFHEPGQVTNFVTDGSTSTKGWLLCFHPDLIGGSTLAEKMGSYTYFSYSIHEALHLSHKEKETINALVQILEDEFKGQLDVYSNKLIQSNLEVLLNYCDRFYGRQFITRQTINLKGVSRFDKILKERMSRQVLEDKGIPSVKELADLMGYSANYLSDLLRKETGRSTLDHVHEVIIKEAKNLLLGSDESISHIAYSLGYDYPEHFTKLFKKKVGVSPSQFRTIN